MYSSSARGRIRAARGASLFNRSCMAWSKRSGVDVKTNTERGSISGSIYITYLTGVIRVSSAREGNEIYSTTLDRIKGYGLDYDRSSIDAYNKTVETLEKNNMNELLDTVLH
jgi:hypothetical protein